jgi:hypothetical protein
MDAYRMLMARAQGVASTPYSPYLGLNQQVYSPQTTAGQTAAQSTPAQQPQQPQQQFDQQQFVPVGEGSGYWAPAPASTTPPGAAPATPSATMPTAAGANSTGVPAGLTYGDIASQLVAPLSPYTTAAQGLSAYSPLQPYLNAGSQYGLNVGANAQDATQLGNQANQTLQSFGQNVYGQLANYGLGEANQLGGQGAILGSGISQYAGNAGQQLANYGQQSGGNLAQYGTNQAKNLKNYGLGAAGDISNYGVGAGQSLSQYGTQAGQNLGNYGTQAGQGIANYGTQAGQGISQFGTQAGQNIANSGQAGGQNISNYALSQAAAGPQAQQFNSASLGQYMSPYNQAVINSTLANINQQNAIDQNNLLGRAISSGNAFGGDRAGIAAAELARNQEMAKNQTIAGLENQNYAQALGQFNTNNAQALAGSQLGLSGLTTGQQLGIGAQTTGAQLGLGAQQAGSQLGLGAQQSGAQLGVGALGQGAQLGVGAQQAGSQLGLGALGQGAQIGTGSLGQAAQLGSNALAQGAQLGLGGQQAGYGLGLQGVQSGANTQMQGLQAGVNAGLQGIGQGAQYGLAGLQSGNQLGLAGQQLGLSGNATASGLMGNLGQIAQQGNLQNQQALYTAGAQQQQNQQSLLDAAYQQYQAAQGYPFSTTQFLANTLLGTGAAMGGTSTATGTAPAPNQTGQYIGLGLGGLGLLGGLGFLARGGRVPSYAGGGTVDDSGKVFASPEDQQMLNADEPLTPDRANAIYDAYVRVGGGRDVSDSQFVKNSQSGIYPWSSLLNYLSAINLQRGGRIHGFASGGATPFAGIPWIPLSQVSSGGGKGIPGPASLPGTQGANNGDLLKTMGNVKALTDLGKTLKGGPSGMFPSGATSLTPDVPNVDVNGVWNNPDNFDVTLGSGATFRRGGLVPRYAQGGMATGGLSPLNDPDSAQMAQNVAGFADAFRSMRHRAMGGAVQPAPGLHYDDGGSIPNFDQTFDAVQQPDGTYGIDPAALAASASAPPAVPAGLVPLPQTRPQIADQAPTLPPPVDIPPAPGLAPRDDAALPPAAQPTSYSPFAGAISNIESGGKYDAIGPTTKDGDAALGKYQVMGKNVGPWTREVLGQELTPQQFLASPAAQDAVFNAKFGQYAQKYGPEGAARAWFAGEGGMNDLGRKDQFGTSVSNYASRFMSGLGGSSASPPQQVAQAQPQGGPNRLDSFMNSPWGALTMIGASMAASKSPYIGGQLGEGILGGLSSYEAARKMSLDADRIRAQMQHQDTQLQESIRHNKATEGLQQQQLQRQVDIANVQSLQPVKIGTDVLGHDIYGVRDPKTGQIRIIDPTTGKILAPGQSNIIGVPANPTPSVPEKVDAGGDDASIPSKAKPVQGGFPATDWKPDTQRNEDFLASLPPAARNTIKNIADYKLNPQSLGYKDRTAYLNLVTQYDPSYDMTRFRTINDARKNFSGTGVEARNFSSNDMAIKHIGSALDNIEAVGNYTYAPGVLNPIRGAIKRETDPQYQAARKNLEVDIDAVANELMRSFRGSGSASEKEATEWRSKFPINGSPVEQRAAMAEAARLLASRVTASGNRFNDAMGPSNVRDPYSWLSPEGQDVIRFATQMDPQKPIPKDWRLLSPGGHMTDGQSPAPQNPSAPKPPVVGEVRKGYRFKGGDWKKRDNWERVQ